MLISQLITSAILLASTTINALPFPTSVDKPFIRDEFLITRGIPQDLAKHAVAAIKTFGPPSSKTMMHSGIGPAKAFQVAKAKQLQTVETTIFKAINNDKASKKNIYKNTLQKYCIPKADYCAIPGTNVNDWVEAWGVISKAWASYTTKETTLATVKEGPNAKSFYKVFEEPILTSNRVSIKIDNTYPAGDA